MYGMANTVHDAEYGMASSTVFLPGDFNFHILIRGQKGNRTELELDNVRKILVVNLSPRLAILYPKEQECICRFLTCALL